MTTATVVVRHVNIGTARRLKMGERSILSAIGKTPVTGTVAVGPLEHEVFVGDEWHFPDCVLRVTAPREPCFKFAAVMGFAQAGRAMAVAGCCGYYLAVDRPGTIAAGQTATLVAGQRGLSIAQAFAGKFAKHAR